MANAKYIDGPPKITVTPGPILIVLTLSQDEASTLRYVMERIGGAPQTSARGMTDDINSVLRELGVANQNELTGDFSGSSGTLFFKEHE